MPRRTSPRGAQDILDADDLEDLVKDKREGWRATAAKARRRQRRYQKLLMAHLPREASDAAADPETLGGQRSDGCR
jgi:hypothetical protein